MRRSEMQPYYQDESVTLYHGDCADLIGPILCDVGLFDAVVTDPPYGIDHGNGGGSSAKHGWESRRSASEWDRARPSPDLIRACLLAGTHRVLWGGNYFLDSITWSHRNKWLIWDKGQTDFSLADCEMAWCSWDGAIRRILYSRGAALKDGKQHPTQKPEAVMAWTLQQLPAGVRTVLDPFAGSGTTLVEAKRVGIKSVGIERHEAYCEIAARRLAQGALPLEFSA